MVGALRIAALIIAGAPPNAQPSPSPPRVALHWVAPPQCPSAADVQRRIDHYLATSNRTPDAPLRVKAEVRGVEGRYAIAIEIEGMSGARLIEGPSCDELAEAAAFVVSLTFDPTAAQAQRREDPVAEQEPPAPPPPPPSPSPSPSPSPKKPRVFIALRAEAGPSIGVLPRVGALVGVAVAVGFRRLRVELLGRYAPTQFETVPDGDGARIGLMAGFVASRWCGVLYAKAVEFPLCAHVELGAVRGRGLDVAQPATEHRLWAGVGAGPNLAVPLGPIALWAGVEAVAMLVRPEFQVDGAGRVYQLGPVDGRAMIGLEGRFRATKAGRSGK